MQCREGRPMEEWKTCTIRPTRMAKDIARHDTVFTKLFVRQ